VRFDSKSTLSSAKRMHELIARSQQYVHVKLFDNFPSDRTEGKKDTLALLNILEFPALWWPYWITVSIAL